MSEVWYYAQGDAQVGPLTLQELKNTLATLPNSNDVLVWCDGLPSWKPARDIVELRKSAPPPLPSRDSPKQIKPGSSDIPGVTYWVQDDGSVIALMADGERCQFRSWVDFWKATEQQRGIASPQLASQRNSRIAIVAVGVLIGIVVVGLLSQPEKQKSAAPPPVSGQTVQRVANPVSAEEQIWARMPEHQVRLESIVEEAQRNYKTGSNEMAKGAARPARARAICAAFPPGRPWIGKVATLTTNNDGRGVLSIRVGKNMHFKTWNNALSDINDQTLIPPDSELYRRAIALRVGQFVEFSGSFIRSPTDCIHEASLTMEGSMTEPEFIFRFTALSPL